MCLYLETNLSRVLSSDLQSPFIIARFSVKHRSRFLVIIFKHFLKHHKYYKLFNRNNVKISYSCKLNMASIIQKHNTNLLKDTVASTVKECSCRQKSNCPLAEKCLSECLVSHVQVDRSHINQTKNY